MLSPCILPTTFLRRESISAKTDDNEAESGGCEVETPNPVCELLQTPTPEGCDGIAVAMTFLTGSTRDEPEPPEPGSLCSSLLVPSPLFVLEPIAETIGAREVPDMKKN